MAEPQFLIMKAGLFYRPRMGGYTGVKDEAGRYSKEEARRLCDRRADVSYMPEGDAPDYAPACFWDIRLEHEARRAETRADFLAAALRQIAELPENGQARNIAQAALADGWVAGGVRR